MNRASRLRVHRLAPSLLIEITGVFALGGCGGAAYSLGSIPEDGGTAAAESAPDGGTSGQNGGASRDAGESVGCQPGAVCSGFAGADAGSGGSFNATEDSGAVVVEQADSGNGCSPASSGCASGTTGYSCTDPQNPASANPSLSCTNGLSSGIGTEHYCCFDWPTTAGPCAPLLEFGCDGNSFAYQCTPGTTPSHVVSNLSCGPTFPDSNGKNDFCCTYQ